MQSQRQLQLSLEAHGRYIASLMEAACEDGSAPRALLQPGRPSLIGTSQGASTQAVPAGAAPAAAQHDRQQAAALAASHLSPPQPHLASARPHHLLTHPQGVVSAPGGHQQHVADPSSNPVRSLHAPSPRNAGAPPPQQAAPSQGGAADARHGRAGSVDARTPRSADPLGLAPQPGGSAHATLTALQDPVSLCPPPTAQQSSVDANLGLGDEDDIETQFTRSSLTVNLDLLHSLTKGDGAWGGHEGREDDILDISGFGLPDLPGPAQAAAAAAPDARKAAAREGGGADAALPAKRARHDAA